MKPQASYDEKELREWASSEEGRQAMKRAFEKAAAKERELARAQCCWRLRR